MPQVLIYLLFVLLGTVAAFPLAGLISLHAGPAASLLLVWVSGAGIFTLIANAIVSQTGVRAFFRNASTSRGAIALGCGVAVLVADVLIAVMLSSLGMLRRTGVLLGLDQAAAGAEVSGPSAAIMLAIFGALLFVLLAVDFLCAASPRWMRIRAFLADDSRGMFGLTAGAVLLGVAAACIVTRQLYYLAPVGGVVMIFAAGVLLDRLLGSSRIWAVARHMIAEGVRMKIALVFIGAVVLILPVLPFTIAGDGLTLKSRIQSFLAYSLGAVGAMLSLLTVFLSCAAVANEVRSRQIFMVTSKPIPRWQFFAGKWLGIGVLNAALLLGTGLTVWGFAWYLKDRPTTVEGDHEAVMNEVLSARYGAKPEEPNWDAAVDQRLREIREQGKTDTLTGSEESSIRTQILQDKKLQWRTLNPGEYQDFIFRGLIVDREKPGWLHLHFKPQPTSGVEDLMFRAQWQAGDRSDPNTLMPVGDQEFIGGRFHSIPISLQAVNAKGDLHLRLYNACERDGFLFEGADDFELLYDLGTFHWNLFRALFIIWCRLALIAVIGLLASSCVSFAVACIASFLVLGTASMWGFLNEAVGAAAVKPSGEDPLWIVGPILRPLASVFLWVVPDFSAFDPVGTLVEGRVVPLKWVLISFFVLVLAKGLVLGIIGSICLTKRELARVVV